MDGRVRSGFTVGPTCRYYPLSLLIPSRRTVRSVVGVYHDSRSSAHPADIKSCLLPNSLPMVSTLRRLGSFDVRRRPCLRLPSNSPATGMTVLAPGMLGTVQAGVGSLCSRSVLGYMRGRTLGWQQVGLCSGLIIPDPYTNIHTHQVNRVKNWTRTRTHRVSVGYRVSSGYGTVKYKSACKLMNNTVYDRCELINNITARGRRRLEAQGQLGGSGMKIEA
jgi:hypothetical protein